MAIVIPDSLQALAKAAVRRVFKKSLPEPDLKPLHDWFEDVGWDEIVMSVQGGCVSLENISERFFMTKCCKTILTQMHVGQQLLMKRGSCLRVSALIMS